MLTNRISSLDIAKGILIILVVIGHSGSPLTQYIFWFHMPAFFFITGLLYKELRLYTDCQQYLYKKYKNYITLYIVYFVLLIMVSFVYINPSSFSWYKTFLKFIIGGRFVGRELGVFWYISCLLFSLTIFTFLLNFIKQKKYQILILVVFYLLAHIESYFAVKKGVTLLIPFNLDVALLAVCYIAAGFYLKDWIVKLLNSIKLNIVATLVLTVGALLFIILNIHGLIRYQLDMKGALYTNILGDILIPVTFTILILNISKLLDFIGIFKFLNYFGQYSIAIMFLHFSILEIYKHYFTYNWVIFSGIGSLIPLLFAFICDQNKITRMLFLKGYQ